MIPRNATRPEEIDWVFRYSQHNSLLLPSGSNVEKRVHRDLVYRASIEEGRPPVVRGCLTSAQNVGLMMKSVNDPTGLKANSCENAYYAMSTPLGGKNVGSAIAQ
jgi:hypothetical protein